MTTLFFRSLVLSSLLASLLADDATQSGASSPAPQLAATKYTSAGHYAPVNGLKLYYEVHGRGKPLVLLHGGVGASEMFAPILTALASGRQDIAVDLQAHGRTADIDRPLRFELMADDIAALVKHLGLQKVDVLGFSLGGGVALRTAIQHPEVVGRLVLVATTCKRDGWYPEVLSAMGRMGPQAASSIKQTPLFRLYPHVDWAGLFTKLADLLKQDYDWSKEVKALRAPTMLVFADADAVRIAHVMEFFALLGGGQKDAGLDGSQRPAAQFAIFPGFTHYNVLSSPALPGLVSAFLDRNARRP
jgi:pimeloyl-ACP methyl ester carboxylesterase